MTWENLLKVKIVDWGITLEFGPLVIVILFIAAIIYLIFFFKKCGWKSWSKWEAVSADIPIGNLGTVTVRPNHDTVKVAYKAWIELTTRKAALPFDKEHDVISEVYNSWYELFGRLRELAKEIPAQQLRRNKDTRELVRVMVVVLNDGLRPHLTQWQARFRKWYDTELEKSDSKGMSPQEIQKKYPNYDKLVEEMKYVNKAIVEYAKWLRQIAEGNK